ncbi:hypothetical protein O1611_g8040 [Lasiodiplodia mahajangana]|uniref:Uncharacterized protein n=1 Tax=Lasiodiplodia mahajangana TaxID=1108764 RepID=A0ACC2JDX4_9PEZI|nr:hypothetical protein O1611_g8040 [Lasiodiplodia mahajangana]
MTLHGNEWIVEVANATTPSRKPIKLGCLLTPPLLLFHPFECFALRRTIADAIYRADLSPPESVLLRREIASSIYLTWILVTGDLRLDVPNDGQGGA